MKDYYKVLGLSPEASNDQVKKRYRELSKTCHPDLFPNDKEKEEEFRELNEAYNQILNKSKGIIPLPGNPIIRIECEYTLKELHKEEEKEVSFEIGEDICPYCKGSGKVRRQEQNVFGYFIQDGPCSHCNGTGRVGNKVTKTIKIKVAPEMWNIPVNVDDIQVQVFPTLIYDSKFTRRDVYNIDTFVEISPITAILGGEAKVDTLDGHINIKIPEGTQYGKVFVAKNKGLRNKGDLYITTFIKIPTNISEKEKELYNQIQEFENN